MKKVLIFAMLLPMVWACKKDDSVKNPDAPKDPLVQPTSISMLAFDTIYLTADSPFAYTMATSDSCVVRPLNDTLGVVGLVVGEATITVSDTQGHSQVVPVVVKPRVTQFLDPQLLFGCTAAQLQETLGKPLSNSSSGTTTRLFYKLSADGDAYTTYVFEKDSLATIYAYPETYYQDFYSYLNERYFMEAVNLNSANYYNHFDLNRASLRIHFGYTDFGDDGFWFAEYSLYDPLNPYAAPARN